MPFQIVRNDITQMKVDAIVNTANPNPEIGWGVDAGIHKKAGPRLLLERLRIGRISVGGAAVTRAYDLPAKFVIHTVGPVWQGGGKGEEQLLKSCYKKSLALAKRKGCRSIAFPLISAGNHGFPKPAALTAALDAIREFLMEEDMLVYLVVYSSDAFSLSEKLFRDVRSFIDDNYTQQNDLLQYGVEDKCLLRNAQQTRILEAQRDFFPEEPDDMPSMAPEAPCDASFGAMPFPCPAPPPCAAPSPAPLARTISPKAVKAVPSSLEDMLRQEDAGFSERLLQLIDRSGKKDSQVYARANVSRQHFSKIRNDPHYKPTKSTALAFAIALELDMEQTEDLIGRAGFALTRSSKSDLIIMYFIQTGNFDIFAINAALFEFDQRLLGV